LRISWSQVRSHDECHQRSALLRSGKRNPLANIRGFYHGMVVDQAMRDWLADPEHPSGAMRAAIDELIDTLAVRAREDGDGVLKWKDAGDRADLREFCVTLVDRLEPILYQHVLPYPYEAGKWFALPAVIPYLDGTPTTITLVGEMDLLVQRDGYRPLDLKGTRDNNYWRKIVGQLVFYDLAVMMEYGQKSPGSGVIQPMCTQQVLEFVFTDEHRRTMWTRILALANDIWRGEARCTTNIHACGFCSVKHACPRFAPTTNSGAFGVRAPDPRRLGGIR
jgi:hypothetical protein